MFKDSVVVVTGGAQGIGKGIVLAYARHGAKVVIADLNDGLGQQLEQDMLAQGYAVLFVQTDVTKEQDIVQLMQRAVEQYGTIHILINNAGQFQHISPYDVTFEEWNHLLHTNLTSAFFCAREAAKVMRHNVKGGSIVSLASTRAEMSEPNTEAYAATKGGIVALTHALARSLGPDQITVNCISPGWIETGDYEALRPVDHVQHLSGRVGVPEDIAQACLYLTNPVNNFVTGINLTVDGGMTKKMMYEE
ncbi:MULTISPECIES: glucose 1-dehydrogenase [Lysinibacillus]|jgi:NAD(P)-dependent dehydrogenase (short-subunit alcohol dehydrogenase family)|uniref:3-ketoacyl-ACP reductase n=1 Tax=Lysinibacillus fusiformis TaxID=28031 RepID=A0A2I0V1P3_9BACI|nr:MULTISPECIES: glucose 1-dehydrogenase [Lysinibacillus]KUF32742.1 3-ketoacyl-ACP reductase [Lysinibacillus sp. F5]PKU52231.1 3-ketoacyl-ACP reductase [Lysinibacillus fusiformis]